MRVLLAGATGAIGRHLLPMLVEAGHEVTGTTRSTDKFEIIANAGATPVAMDALDGASVKSAVVDAQPEVVIHELTGFSEAKLDFKNLDASAGLTNRLRAEGTDHLLAAALDAGVERLIVQAYTGLGVLRSADGGLDPDRFPAAHDTVAANVHLEQVVPSEPGLVGIVLRYGSWYGPGTGMSKGGEMVELVRKRRFPIVGNGAGVTSFSHITDAARATLQAVDHGSAGVYDIVDDDPAPIAEWLPALAAAVGAKPPRRIPAWLARLFVGEYGVAVMTESHGASNGKAKRELDWTLRYPSWREGFRTGLG